MRPMRDLLIEPDRGAWAARDVQRDADAVFQLHGGDHAPVRGLGASGPARTTSTIWCGSAYADWGSADACRGLPLLRPAGGSGYRRGRRPGAGTRPAGGAGARRGGQLPRRAVDRRQVPGQDSAAVHPGQRARRGGASPSAKARVSPGPAGFGHHVRRRVRRAGAARRAPGDRPIPDDVDFASAAAFGVTYRTAYHALRSIAAVAEGDWVVVLGAAGGVGLAAVDLAVGDGGPGAGRGVESGKARAVPAARRGGHGRLRPGGPEDPASANSPATRHAWCSTRSADVMRSRRCAALARGGTFVTLGYAAGAIPSIPLNLVLLKGITVRGMEIRTFIADQARRCRARHAGVDRRCSPTGAVRPYIGARFPLAETAGGVTATSPTARRSARWSSTSLDIATATRVVDFMRSQPSALLVTHRLRRDDVERRVGLVEHAQQRLQGRLVAGQLEPR